MNDLNHDIGVDYWTADVDAPKRDTVTISVLEYMRLQQAELVLSALEAEGVDTWPGYQKAIDSLSEEEV